MSSMESSIEATMHVPKGRSDLLNNLEVPEFIIEGTKDAFLHSYVEDGLAADDMAAALERGDSVDSDYCYSHISWG